MPLKLLLRFFIALNNLSYTVISSLVVRENHGLHPKHRIMQYHMFFLEHIHAADTVLDIGCGNGALAADLATKARHVLAIDINPRHIIQAKQSHARPNIEYLVGDATTKNFSQPVHSIVLSNVLEHIEHRKDFLEKIKTLAPVILIRVPLITRDWLAVYKKEQGFEYRLDPTHFVEYTEEQFANEMSTAGLKIVSTHIKFGELYAVITTGS